MRTLGVLERKYAGVFLREALLRVPRRRAKALETAIPSETGARRSLERRVHLIRKLRVLVGASSALLRAALEIIQGCLPSVALVALLALIANLLELFLIILLLLVVVVVKISTLESSLVEICPVHLHCALVLVLFVPIRFVALLCFIVLVQNPRSLISRRALRHEPFLPLLPFLLRLHHLLLGWPRLLTRQRIGNVFPNESFAPLPGNGDHERRVRRGRLLRGHCRAPRLERVRLARSAERERVLGGVDELNLVLTAEREGDEHICRYGLAAHVSREAQGSGAVWDDGVWHKVEILGKEVRPLLPPRGRARARAGERADELGKLRA
mmetsp:Transcript_22684/g.73792  ORF Transcript_22684/g.73792 Transcript_22684/m.73792 type:complete len:326 (+) Transcript_22684:804-1781(+)